jgi:hypothetical protein
MVLHGGAARTRVLFLRFMNPWRWTCSPTRVRWHVPDTVSETHRNLLLKLCHSKGLQKPVSLIATSNPPRVGMCRVHDAKRLYVRTTRPAQRAGVRPPYPFGFAEFVPDSADGCGLYQKLWRAHSMIFGSGAHHGSKRSSCTVSHRKNTRCALMISQDSRSDASFSSKSVKGSSAVFDPRDCWST